MTIQLHMTAPAATSGISMLDKFLADTIVENMQKDLHMITQDNTTVLFTRITGLENGEARIYGEQTHIKDDVARLAYMVEQFRQLMLVCILAMLMMLGTIIIMLGYIIYVQSLPVTVCPHHAEPVDVCKNATNTIIGGLRCLTDKILPKPCRNGFGCKRETYPDW